MRAALALACVVLPVAALAATPAMAPDNPDKMLPEPIAVLQGLNKTTARVSDFDAPVGVPVHFGTLTIVARDCETNPPEARPENVAFLQIEESRPGEQAVSLFSGWMFSSSPALSALEHPVYDIAVLACKAASGSSPALPTAAPGKATGKAAR